MRCERCSWRELGEYKGFVKRSLQGVPEWIRVGQLGYSNYQRLDCWNLKGGGGETGSGERGILEDMLKRYWVRWERGKGNAKVSGCVTE